MVVQDCLTDFRYTGSQPAAKPTYAFMHKGTISADDAALLHHPNCISIHHFLEHMLTTLWSACQAQFPAAG